MISYFTMQLEIPFIAACTIFVVNALNETCESDAADYNACLRKNGLGLKPEEEHQVRLNTCSLQVGCKCAGNDDTQSLSAPFLALSPQNDAVALESWKKCRDKVDDRIFDCVKNDSSGLVFPQPPPMTGGNNDVDILPNCTDSQKTQVEFCLLKSQPRPVNFIQKHNSDCRANRQCFLLMKPECQKLLLDSQSKACKCTMKIQPMLQVQLCLNDNTNDGDNDSQERSGSIAEDPSVSAGAGPGMAFAGPSFPPPPLQPRMNAEACQMNDVCKEIPMAGPHHRRPYLPIVPTFPL